MQIQNVLHAGKYKCAAVMICLYEEEGEQYIVLEKRANGIRQGGEISLPGGKRDLRDVDFKMTAIRETSEELGISKEKIEYIGYAGCGRYDIAVAKFDVFALGRRQQGVDDDFDQVIPLPDDGRAYASYHGSDRF